MKTRTQKLSEELLERWLTLEPEVQELMVMTARIFTGDREPGTEGLPNYEAAIKRMDAEIEAKYGRKE